MIFAAPPARLFASASTTPDTTTTQATVSTISRFTVSRFTISRLSTALLAPTMASPQSHALRAVYTSPQPETQPQTFQRQLPSLPVSSESASLESLKTKSTYLAELRQLVPQLQDEINGFLTERMEEDKQAAEEQGAKQLEQEAKEEENYGEENVEEDA